MVRAVRETNQKTANVQQEYILKYKTIIVFGLGGFVICESLLRDDDDGFDVEPVTADNDKFCARR